MFANLIAHMPMLLCLLLGAGLIIAEVFLPGFGLPGIMGVALLGTGAVIAWVSHGALFAMAALLIVIAVLAVLISWVLRRVSKGGMAHSELFLSDKEDLHTQQDMQVLVGKTGKTTSVLRPAGIADFDGVRLNVVTEGDFMERGTDVEIVSVQGTKIVVRARA